MKKSILKNRKRWCTGIAIYQILGAAVSVILICTLVPNLSAGVIFALVPLLAMCLMSLLAGVLFFVKGNESRFFTLSKLNFCLQIPQLSMTGFAFAFYYGPYLAVGFGDGSNLLGKFEMLTSNVAFQIGGAEPFYILLNLVPLFLLIILRWIERNPMVTAPELENAFVEESEV